MLNRHKYLLTLLFTLSLCWSWPVIASAPTYIGLAIGDAKSSEKSKYDTASSIQLFLGIQSEHYFTYEAGISLISTSETDNPAADNYEIDMLSLSALGHLPIGNSSLFVRFGLNNWDESLDYISINNGFAASIGTGVDLAITPRLTMRLDWQRYFNMNITPIETDIDTIQIGLLYYF